MDGDIGPIELGERIIALLAGGSFTATYKYALLLALLDLCLEKTSDGGIPPTTITTREVATKVIELYWPHSLPFSQRMS